MNDPRTPPGQLIREAHRRGDLERLQSLVSAYPDEGRAWAWRQVQAGAEAVAADGRPLLHRGDPNWLDALPVELPLRVLGIEIQPLRDDRSARLFACDCAEDVLPLYESAHPDDLRPRYAIETARSFANGLASQEELDAARSAAWYAASAAAKSAAKSASTAVWSAVWSASMSAASTAWSDASAARYTSWLVEYLLTGERG